jgi:hypothetical protein
MEKYCRLLFYGVFQALSWSTLSTAYPNEAGSCVPGVPVMGIHLENQVTTGELSEGNFQVVLNDSLILVPDQPFDVLLGDIGKLSIVSTDPKTSFRGFLIRIETDEIDALTPVDFDDQVQIASSCSVIGVPGISHLSSADKTQIVGSLILQKASRDLSMDVTVVVEADESASKFYHSTFTLSVTDDSTVATFSPTFLSPAMPTNLISSTGAPSMAIPGSDTNFPFVSTEPNIEDPSLKSFTVSPDTETPGEDSNVPITIAPNIGQGLFSSVPITLPPDTRSPSIGVIPTTSPPSHESYTSGPEERTESPSMLSSIPTSDFSSSLETSRPSKAIPPIFFSDDRPSHKSRRIKNKFQGS